MKISERFARHHEAEKHELDLDALAEDFENMRYPDGLALIQRLREAEAEVGVQHRGWVEAEEAQHRLHEALREAEAAIANHQTLTTAEQTVRVLRERIAQLERVREAASQFIEMVDRVNERPRREGVEMRAVAAQGALRAALEL